MAQAMKEVMESPHVHDDFDLLLLGCMMTL